MIYNLSVSVFSFKTYLWEGPAPSHLCVLLCKIVCMLCFRLRGLRENSMGTQGRIMSHKPQLVILTQMDIKTHYYSTNLST